MIKPGLRDAPVPLHGSFRDSKFCANLIFAEASEESHFDYPSLTLIERLKPCERFVKFDNVDGRLCRYANLPGKCHLTPISPAFSSILCSCMINKDLPHRMRRDGKKV